MLRRLLLPSVLIMATLAAASGVAQAQVARSPLSRSVEGVRVDARPGKGLVVSFSDRAGRLFKRIAGRKAAVDCQSVVPNTGPLLTRPMSTTGSGETLLLPRKRRSVRTSFDRDPRVDVCRLTVTRTRRPDPGVRETVVVADLFLPVTQRGAVFLDERTTAGGLSALLDIVGALAVKLPGKRYPTAQEVRDPGSSPAVRRLTALAGPDDTPPVGRLGLWTDGATRAVAVAVTRTGRRIFVEADGETLSTNVAGPLFGDD